MNRVYLMALAFVSLGDEDRHHVQGVAFLVVILDVASVSAGLVEVLRQWGRVFFEFENHHNAILECDNVGSATAFAWKFVLKYRSEFGRGLVGGQGLASFSLHNGHSLVPALELRR